MLNTNVTNFRKNLFELMEQTIRYNEPINVSTKSGNAVVLSEEDYNGMIETLNLLSDPIEKSSLQGAILLLMSVSEKMRLSGNV